MTAEKPRPKPSVTFQVAHEPEDTAAALEPETLVKLRESLNKVPWLRLRWPYERLRVYVDSGVWGPHKRLACLGVEET